MRCPKCSYLSYDDVERCRNCGYDFSLAITPRETEPTVAIEPTHEPRTWEPSRRRRPGVIDAIPPAEGGPLDLPLFEDSPAHEPPPVLIPPAGPPLSVRRKVEITRPPTRAAVDVDDKDPHATSAGFEWSEEPAAPELAAGEPDHGPPVADVADPIGPRLKAGVIDAFVLGSIDLLVFWLTLRVAGVSMAEWRLLPVVPLAGFVFLLDAAYLVTFTAASGQTIGKMSSGLRVVYGDHGRVPFGHAVLRSVALLLCAIPAGLGLLPVFMDPERRGAHDRLAGTRVVPAA